MPASIGVNLRVTGHCRQGGRKYMEDFFSVAYQQTEDERDLEYAFFGIYDGHGGPEAAAFAKEHLMETIVRHNTFWSDNDEDVLKAIKDGYIETHYAMWKEQKKWPKLVSGLPSTAGTTASIAFIRRGKIYIGHVGDSGIILGYQEPGCPDWKARPLTQDHKPENELEMRRIEECGGKVVLKSGVSRVVWKKPRVGHQGPVRRSTLIDEIPFLAIARSLGDLWSYNSQLDEFIISPVPDCSVIPIDTETFRCLIFGTDGLFNMLSAQTAVHIVQQAERHNENAALGDSLNNVWLNPSRCLVDKALERWSTTRNKADNTSVVTLMLDPPGPPRAQVLKNKKKQTYPDSGLQIVTRYEDNKNENEPSKSTPADVEPQEKADFTTSFANEKPSQSETEPTNVNFGDELDKDFVPRVRESTNFEPVTTETTVEATEVNTWKVEERCEESIQINEISSSSSDFCGGREETVKRTRTKRVAENVQTRSKRTRSETFVEIPVPSKKQKLSSPLISRNSLRPKPPDKGKVEGKVEENVVAPKNISVKKKNLLRKVLAPNKVQKNVHRKARNHFKLSQKAVPNGWSRTTDTNISLNKRTPVKSVKPKKSAEMRKTKENWRNFGFRKAQQKKERTPRKEGKSSGRSPLSQRNSTVVERRSRSEEAAAVERNVQKVSNRSPVEKGKSVGPSPRGRSKKRVPATEKKTLRSDLRQYTRNLRKRILKK